MNSAQMVDNLISQWRQQGLSKAEIVVKFAEACMSWPYVWGASGQDCTVDKRRYFMGRSVCPDGDKELIRKRCQVLNGSASSCTGCKYYPGGAKVRIQDCQGFMKELFKAVGITLVGGGATSMWNDNSNWSQKGTIGEMPPGAVCLVFKHIAKTGKMDHVGLHIGSGNIIHCSGEVKRGKTSESGWTHFAIPRGLEGNEYMPVWRPTIRRGSRGVDVVYVQDTLMALGYGVGKSGADGIFGKDTLEAVKNFQRDHGLDADGIVGPLTYEALEKAIGTDDTQPVHYFTIIIKHLTKADAKALAAKYSGSEIQDEGGEAYAGS